MPYILNNAPDPMAIAEREIGVAAEIQFTAFTSCIGVVVLLNGNLTAVHLALTAADGGAFDAAAANVVLAALPAGYTSSIVIGSIPYWENPANGAAVGYAALTAGLINSTLYPLADGTYGAEIDGGVITPTFV
jgi:hypothetical protein